tara:strand:+ start:1386 stop:2468 length:1083 start_codon:yes stop_codon:yes gene_type:complete
MAPEIIRFLPNRYEYIHEKIEGSQADVYICNDNNLERRVAIKAYIHGFDEQELRHEISVLCDGNSQHLAQIYDLIVDDENKPVAFVQEYIAGSCLSEFPQQKRSEPEILNTLYQLASGIHDLHLLNIVHRDIKPSNARFDSNGILKIIDFGISYTPQQHGETMCARGTTGYRAPELYMERPVAINNSFDVYSFGALAWYLASGRLPAALEEIPPQSTIFLESFSSLNLAIPDDISGAIDRCLSVNSIERPSIGEVRKILANCILFGRHRAELIADGKQYILSDVGKGIRIKHGSDKELSVDYDGRRFYISSIVGPIYINNSNAILNAELPNACVITLGKYEDGASRLFVSFSISHPEVVL